MNIYIKNHYIILEDDENGEILFKTKSWIRLEKRMKQILEEREKEKRYACTV